MSAKPGSFLSHPLLYCKAISFELFVDRSAEVRHMLPTAPGTGARGAQQLTKSMVRRGYLTLEIQSNA